MTSKSKKIEGSEEAYDQLKVITDAAQAGELKPWSKPVIELINAYGMTVDRRKGIKAEVTLSFPTSTKNPSMAIGVRHLKDNNQFAEDLYLFEKGVGLTRYYRGSQEEALPEYAKSHHAPAATLTEALPDIQTAIKDLEKKLNAAQTYVPSTFHDVMTPDEYMKQLRLINAKALVQIRHSNDTTSNFFNRSFTILQEGNAKRAEIEARWSESERQYEFEKERIMIIFEHDDQQLSRYLVMLNKRFGKASPEQLAALRKRLGANKVGK